MVSQYFFAVPPSRWPKRELITEEEALWAQHAAAAAARGLYSDALLLYRNGRTARAAALAILALEEIGKVKVLARIAGATDEAALKAGWREYTTHRAKIGEMVATGDAEEVDYRKAFGKEADALKQAAFYSQWLESGDWVWPELMVSPDDADLAIKWAHIMVEQLPSNPQ